MGRRALGKIDSSLELAEHLLVWEDLPQTWSQQAIFECQRPLEIEVGTGKGLFLSAAAAATPDRNFLGIEIAARYARFAAAKLAKRDLLNARVVHADARRLFIEYLPDDALAAVHVYFPDPWWKKRHRKRRVMNSELITEIARTLSSGSRLHFWTDVEEY
ncbi:MAG: tRNA (guanosine(46)-N7)-methyltransferase TrmB, partial [Planctomycetales bacterium]